MYSELGILINSFGKGALTNFFARSISKSDPAEYDLSHRTCFHSTLQIFHSQLIRLRTDILLKRNEYFKILLKKKKLKDLLSWRKDIALFLHFEHTPPFCYY